MGVFNILSSEEKRYLTNIPKSVRKRDCRLLQAAALAAGNMDPLYPGNAVMQLCRSVVISKWASAWGIATKRTQRRWLVSRLNFLFVDLFVFYGKHER